MAGAIIWYVVSFGCAVLFYCIGVYAQRIEKPMWFWSGVEVLPSEITDVKKYNKENAIMWKLYSLWYFAAGFAKIWSSAVAIVFLILSFVAGLPLLVLAYMKIYKKYKA